MNRGEAKIGQRVMVTLFGGCSLAEVIKIQLNGDLVLRYLSEPIMPGMPTMGQFEPRDVEPAGPRVVKEVKR